MPDSYQLRIVTPERTVYDEPVSSVIAPGVDGYFGVLAHHAPMLAEVGIGRLSAQRADGRQDVLAVAGGFLEVGENEVTILADSAEQLQEIDLDRAQQALQRARERLEHRPPELDVERAEAARERARNRINVATQR